MEIAAKAYLGLSHAIAQDNFLKISKQDENGSAQKTESYSAPAVNGVTNAVTGMTSSRVADDTVKALIEQEQEVGKADEVRMGDTSWFEDHNKWSKNDRKLLEAMTGYAVNEHGQFLDKNGKPLAFNPEGDLSHHTLRTFMIMVQSERMSSTGAIAGEEITSAEFKNMMKQVRAVVTGMGEAFNEDYLNKGLAYLEGRSAHFSS